MVDREAALEILRCPLCLRLLFEPLTLECGHSFCRACLSLCESARPRLRSHQTRALACPACRAPAALAAATRPVSFALQQLVELLAPAEELASRREEAVSERVELGRAHLALFIAAEELPLPGQHL